MISRIFVQNSGLLNLKRSPLWGTTACGVTPVLENCLLFGVRQVEWKKPVWVQEQSVLLVLCVCLPVGGIQWRVSPPRPSQREFPVKTGQRWRNLKKSCSVSDSRADRGARYLALQGLERSHGPQSWRRFVWT